MYSHVHGVVGAITYTTTYAITGSHVISGLTAFISHFLMDYLGESGYGSDRFFLQLELSHLVAFGVLGFMSGYFWLYFLGWFWGNLPDLIDKRLFLFYKGQKQYFSCHNHPGWKVGKHRIGIFSFNDWKLGVPVKIKFDKDETVALGVMATALLTIWTWLIRVFIV
jgi:hypothetical protein